MTTYLGKNFSFDCLCVSFVNVYVLGVYVCFFRLGFEGGMLNLIVLVPEHCLSVYFVCK